MTNKFLAVVLTAFMALASLLAMPVSAGGLVFHKVDTTGVKYANPECETSKHLVCVVADRKISFREMLSPFHNLSFSDFKVLNKLPQSITVESMVEVNTMYGVRYLTVVSR